MGAFFGGFLEGFTGALGSSLTQGGMNQMQGDQEMSMFKEKSSFLEQLKQETEAKKAAFSTYSPESNKHQVRNSKGEVLNEYEGSSLDRDKAQTELIRNEGERIQNDPKWLRQSQTMATEKHNTAMEDSAMGRYAQQQQLQMGQSRLGLDQQRMGMEAQQFQQQQQEKKQQVLMEVNMALGQADQTDPEFAELMSLVDSGKSDDMTLSLMRQLAARIKGRKGQQINQMRWGSDLQGLMGGGQGALNLDLGG